MTSKEREALKALVHEMEYVLSCINADKIPFDGDDFHEALRLGKEALNFPNGKAQPEQRSANEHLEPVAGRAIYEDGDVFERIAAMKKNTTAHRKAKLEDTHRSWVGLTDEEIDSIHFGLESSFSDIVREVEAKLKVKNERLEKNT